MSSSRLWRQGEPRRPVLTACSLCFAVVGLWATPASAATLRGRVVDPDGRPVAGARVLVTTALGAQADPLTTPDGQFEIEGLAAGDYDVRIAIDGFAADPVHVVLSSDERRDISVQLRISATTESIIVSASQVELPLSRSADSVTVLTAADIQARQIDTVADALRLVSGLTLARSGGRGALTSLFPRGGASNYTLVLVDGMRANAFGGGFDFGHLGTGDIERIEIVRAPESALFGADAIGAVVQIVTRRGGRPRAEGLLEGGSEAAMRLVANTAGSKGPWTWGAGVERSRSDGYTGIAPASGERVTNDDDRFTRASGTVGWQRPGGADFVFSGNLGRDERGFPGPFGSNPIGVFPGVDRVSRGVNNTRQVGVRFGNPWSPGIRQRVEANYTNTASDFVSRFGPSSSGTARFDARVREDLALSPLVGASVGIEFVREQGSSTFVTGVAGTPLPIHRSVVGSFAELRFVGSDQFFMTGGVRLEHLTRDALEPDPNAFAPRPAFPDQTTNSLNPKIAVSYILAGSGAGSRQTRIHTGAGTGIRPPDVFEIAFTDNPNLKPERNRSVDAGVEQRFLGGTYIVGATWFLNRYDDLLVTVGRSLQDASHYRTDNIANARASGLELSAELRPARPLALRANYMFLDTEILSVDGLDRVAPSPFKVGDALLRRPRNQAELDVTYAAGRVTAFGEVTTRSQVLDVEPNFGSFGGVFFSPGFAIVNVGASVNLAHGLAVYGRIVNLADRRYEEAFGFPAPGRQGIAGVRVTF